MAVWGTGHASGGFLEATRGTAAHKRLIAIASGAWPSPSSIELRSLFTASGYKVLGKTRPTPLCENSFYE